MDDLLVRAAVAPVDDQRKVFFGLARYLYEHQLQDDVEERDDPSDNAQWLANLATWFGWTDDLLDEVKREAMRAALVIRPDALLT